MFATQKCRSDLSAYFCFCGQQMWPVCVETGPEKRRPVDFFCFPQKERARPLILTGWVLPLHACPLISGPTFSFLNYWRFHVQGEASVCQLLSLNLILQQLSSWALTHSLTVVFASSADQLSFARRAATTAQEGVSRAKFTSAP